MSAVVTLPPHVTSRSPPLHMTDISLSETLARFFSGVSETL
jgi:hypothetical protein